MDRLAKFNKIVSNIVNKGYKSIPDDGDDDDFLTSLEKLSKITVELFEFKVDKKYVIEGKDGYNSICVSSEQDLSEYLRTKEFKDAINNSHVSLVYIEDDCGYFECYPIDTTYTLDNKFNLQIGCKYQQPDIFNFVTREGKYIPKKNSPFEGDGFTKLSYVNGSDLLWVLVSFIEKIRLDRLTWEGK